MPGFDAAGWGMLVAPARTPSSIVMKLYNAFRTVEAQSEIRDRLILLSLAPQTSPPPDMLQAFINDEVVRWGKVVAPRASPSPSDRPSLARAALQQRSSDLVPFGRERLGGWFAARLTIPIAGIIEIVLNTMQVSVHPGAILVVAVHHDTMCFIPVTRCPP